jgi:hypothetical protein
MLLRRPASRNCGKNTGGMHERAPAHTYGMHAAMQRNRNLGQAISL